jgi:hypothetical protein
MDEKTFRITWKHIEGDGLFSVATGLPSGIYKTEIQAPSEKEALDSFDACYRHGSIPLLCE